MVIFADKGRPLKPASRIAMSTMVISIVYLLYYMAGILFAFRLAHPVWQAYAIPFVFLVGAGLAIRLVMADWREVVIAAMIPAVFIAALRANSIRDFLIIWPLMTAALFLLPLLDPITRERKPEPPPLKVAGIGTILFVIILFLDYMSVTTHTGTQFFGLGALVMGNVVALTLVAVGLILVLINKTASAAWIGGIGFTLSILSLLSWLALGRPWFP